ncbi:hypothetical protein os4_22960 [Comamonadaceae bacterium OS-4]|nr:hypothetical protein os4_22960 [Comamonadaceae bacterium OS-4]
MSDDFSLQTFGFLGEYSRNVELGLVKLMQGIMLIFPDNYFISDVIQLFFEALY